MQNFREPFSKQLQESNQALNNATFALAETEKEAEGWPRFKPIIRKKMIPVLRDWRGRLQAASLPKLELRYRASFWRQILEKIRERFRPPIGLDTLQDEIRLTKNLSIPWSHPLVIEVCLLRIIVGVKELVVAIIKAILWVIFTIYRIITFFLTLFVSLLRFIWTYLPQILVLVLVVIAIILLFYITTLL